MELVASIFGKDFNEPLVHQVINAYMAGGRSGTRGQKTRAEVSGGGSKPWRQKGSGRARAGTIRSPLWRTGGVTFAAKTQDFTQKVNRKMYRGAMCSILSQLVRLERFVVVQDNKMVMSSPKTKDLIKNLSNLGVTNALLIVKEWDSNLYLSARNIPNVEVCSVDKIDPVTLVKYDKVVITESAVKKIEEVLA